MIIVIDLISIGHINSKKTMVFVRDQWRFNHLFIILETLLFKSRLRYTIKESEFSVVVTNNITTRE